MNFFLSQDFNSVVDIELQSDTLDDVGGEVETNWQLVQANVDACVQANSARRRSASQRADGRVVSHTVWFDPSQVNVSLSKKNRLKLGSRYLNVLDPRDNQERGEILTVDCEENPE